MQIVTVAEIQTKKRRPAIKGIVKAAQDLKCNRYHLSQVIRGERISPGLLAKWHIWHARWLWAQRPQPRKK